MSEDDAGQDVLAGLEEEISTDEHAASFVQRAIVDYDPEQGGLQQAEQGAAYRLGFEYDDGGVDDFVAALRKLADEPAAGRLEALVIGAWGEDTHEGGAPILAALVEIAPKLPNLRALFLGDIVSEECEMSWIHQGDWGLLPAAYPKLEHLRVRGLATPSAFQSETLRSLVVQCGLPREAARRICAADLPRLEHLELWLGTPNYEGDVQVEDLAPLLAGKVFPQLRYLGLRNAEIVDAVCEALADAPIVERLEALDLSLGVLTDAGGQALLSNPALGQLRRLDLHHNFLSEAVRAQLLALEGEVDADAGDADEDNYGDEVYRYVSVGE